MKKSIQLNRRESGFTLVEVIVIIVIAAILGSLLFTFMGSAVTKSAVPVNQARDLGTTMGNIETITAAYAVYLKSSMASADWSTFLSAVINPPSTITITHTIGGSTYSAVALPVTVTTGDQKLISYFMQ